MKRIAILAGICVALIGLYLIARSSNQSGSFDAPSDFRLNEWKADRLDQIRLTFPAGKEIDLKKKDGAWTVNDLPADESRLEQLLGFFDKAQITSRVSTNPANHGSFEVDAAKGLTVALYVEDQQIQQMIVGKTAGGETAYVRLPEQDEVYVMAGLSRYFFTDEVSVWRDRLVASFTADNVRQMEYTESNLDWKLHRVGEEWALSSKWIGPVTLDAEKLSAFLGSVAGVQATEFATAEEVAAVRDKKATFAKAIVEIGTPETFERRETWSVYADQPDRYLIVRESDNLGFYVSKDTADSVLTDYADIKARLIPSPAEAKTETPASDTK